MGKRNVGKVGKVGNVGKMGKVGKVPRTVAAAAHRGGKDLGRAHAMGTRSRHQGAGVG